MGGISNTNSINPWMQNNPWFKQKPVDFENGNNPGWSVAGTPSAGGVNGPAPYSHNAYYVQSENGDNIAYANASGHVGCKNMAEGPGSDYVAGRGHSNYSKWLIA